MFIKIVTYFDIDIVPAGKKMNWTEQNIRITLIKHKYIRCIPSPPEILELNLQVPHLSGYPQAVEKREGRDFN